MPWWGRYVGVPFADRGFDLAGCHCWGLVWLVYQDRGIELPRHGELSAADLVRAAREFRSGAGGDGTWQSVAEPRAFDLALMTAMTDGERPMRVPGHVGVMVDDRRVLHVEKATCAVVMPIDHPRIRHRLISFHRHRRFA